jgi:hypothetical protein
VPSATITINGPTTYRDLYTLLKGSQPGPPYSGLVPSPPITGYVVAPAQGIIGLGVGQRISHLSIQASPTNATGSYVYVGDENLAPGTAQGLELTPGEISVRELENVSGLGQIYLGASVSGLKANIDLFWE